MTQTELDRAVAEATGETVATIAQRGFFTIDRRPRRTRTAHGGLGCLRRGTFRSLRAAQAPSAGRGLTLRAFDIRKKSCLVLRHAQFGSAIPGLVATCAGRLTAGVRSRGETVC